MTRAGGRTAAVGWSEVAAAYAETFAPLCAGTFDAVLAAAGVGAGGTTGTRVLDAGTGTGGLAARVAAAGAEVTAVDPDPDMLRIAAEAAPTARLVTAGLPGLPFADGAFGAVVCNFVVNHLPDPRAGVRELARVAAPGARVAVTIWPSGQNTQSRLWAEVIAESGAVVPPGTRLPEELDFPRTAEGLAGLLAAAGLREVTAEPFLWEHRAAPDSLWRGAAAGVGGIGRTVTDQPPAVREAMQASYDRLVQRHVEHGVLVLATEAVLAAGTR